MEVILESKRLTEEEVRSRWKKANDPGSGIKDFEWLQTLAQSAGMQFVTDVKMPANNRSLIWKKRTL
jgi:hypothetical protein